MESENADCVRETVPLTQTTTQARVPPRNLIISDSLQNVAYLLTCLFVFVNFSSAFNLADFIPLHLLYIPTEFSSWLDKDTIFL